jgi:DNA-binding CsgD family transcriptional regulator/PAS domain-containing protein
VFDSELIQHIFDAPIAGNGWPRALTSLADALESKVPALVLRTPYAEDSGLVVAPGLSQEQQESWIWALAGDPEIPDMFLRSEPGSARAFGSTDPSIKNTPISEWANRESYPEAMVGVLWREHSQGGMLVMMRDSIPFSESEVERFKELLPYLTKSVEIQRRLEWLKLERDSARAVLDRLGVGVVLTKPDGEVVHTNQRANEMLEERDGLALDGDALVADDDDANAQMRQITELSSDMARGGTPYPGGSVRVPRTDGRAAIEASVAPLVMGSSNVWHRERPSTITFLTDPDKLPQLAHSRLARLYRLTPSEAQLASHLARGGSIESAAAEFGRSRDTLRKHLQSTFEKTGTHRQAELVALLLRGRL